jgi:hypothetical protein
MGENKPLEKVKLRKLNVEREKQMCLRVSLLAHRFSKSYYYYLLVNSIGVGQYLFGTVE